ncbi:hypothetical protein EVAR_16100_1 [Eumeta japonica]|uniref:Uncharacterized protein n=1 Tax=Eumeta variegata TaxID=151549 RepID=A0A4C1UJH7_EUMVA|nr:hypothetical protein EVAR_16100_1 [Eumeta japonica]
MDESAAAGGHRGDILDVDLSPESLIEIRRARRRRTRRPEYVRRAACCGPATPARRPSYCACCVNAQLITVNYMRYAIGTFKILDSNSPDAELEKLISPSDRCKEIVGGYLSAVW